MISGKSSVIVIYAQQLGTNFFFFFFSSLFSYKNVKSFDSFLCIIAGKCSLIIIYLTIILEKARSI